MRTDCQALLATLRAGVEEATSASRPLARLWSRAAQALDGRFDGLSRDGLLVWMPAHLGVGAVGEAKLSDGSRLTTGDWRANRLADALAKQAAGKQLPVAGVGRLLAVASKAVRHAAKLLGRVTHAANHYTVAETGADGQVHTRVLRDAAPAERPRRASTRGPAVPPARPPAGGPTAAAEGQLPAAAVPALPTQMQAPTAIPAPLPPRAASAPPRPRGLARLPAAIVASIAERQGPSGNPPAAVRMAALRARVLARAGGGAATSAALPEAAG